MKKILIIVLAVMAAGILIGCAAASKPAKVNDPDDKGEIMVVGKDIIEEDINEFYYTIENINYDAYYLRYKLYNEDGKHMFFFEERKRPDDYGPTTEEDTVAKCEFDLSDKEWSRFYEIISGGEVTARGDDPETGDEGPWTYLYWTGDEGDIQQYSFESEKKMAAFKKLCERLVKKNSEKAEEESSGSKKKKGRGSDSKTDRKTDRKAWKTLDGADEPVPEPENEGYIFPDSDTRLLTEDDLEGMSNEELRRGRNEIAARHGRRFTDGSLQEYFDSQSWYEGTIDADDFNKEVRLSDIEQENMEFIKKHEE